MPSTDPYQVHDFTALFTILITAPLVLVGLIAYLGSRLAPKRLRSPGSRTPAAVCRDVAALSAAIALALYGWGCLQVAFLGRQGVGNACAEEAGGARVTAFHGDFVPLRIVCRVTGGDSFTVVVPDHLNTSIIVSLLLALACGAASLLLRLKQPVLPTAQKEGRPDGRNRLES
ncbi:hypothetical protein A4U61_32745 [Streptomyces sp. H-KF8]|uniref:hypothetical protein n=1 Tax=Streptomyces sp. H-KF8 TaxID=1727216 RepID=UPI0007EC7FD6|nr:hypothetical protein [Streptomyces sp. H-KF8]OBQ49643.1 hypothetical protein A4U61_32745 [Streptomyces sp. H-KF8]